MRRMIEKGLGAEAGSYEATITRLYGEEMSAPEISEWIGRETGLKITARSIQRTLHGLGLMRARDVAFRLAMKRGRVVWQLEEDATRKSAAKHQLARGLRFKILERDRWTCQLCGMNPEQGGLMQVDHIKARVHGGEDTEENLRTLCLDCNAGKREARSESSDGTMRSGIEKVSP